MTVHELNMAREIVLAKWPDAVAIEALSSLDEGYFWIHCGDYMVGHENERLARGETEAEAWTRAAANVRSLSV